MQHPHEISKLEKEFLNESNAIEGVTDLGSLTQAAFAWIWLKEQKKMTIRTVLKTHKILMLHQPLYPNEKGYWREVPVFVGGRAGADWRTIQTKVKAWAQLMNDKNIVDWKTLHIMYEKIHPFVDGNGRTGRMFMNYHRLRLGLPLLIIHAGKEQQEYYKWFDEH